MVERYSRGVRFVLLQLTREPARADDLYQETFRLALEKVRGGELREPDKLSPFISALARNLFLAEVRRSGKHQEVSGELESEDAEPRDDAPGLLTRLLDKEDAALARSPSGSGWAIAAARRGPGWRAAPRPGPSARAGRPLPTTAGP